MNSGQSTNPAHPLNPGHTETFAEGKDLILRRWFAAPPDRVYQAWTQPELLTQWFAPRPWTAPIVEVDVRPGGSNLVVMRGPDGIEFPNRGVYLEIAVNQLIVFTDAFISAWEPSEKPFMTVILTFAPVSGGTLYTARVRHATIADREAHETMGFHQGWALCADQLGELVEK